VILGIRGPIESGKSTILTYLMLLEAQNGKLAFANYPIDAAAFGQRVYHIPVLSFIDLFQQRQLQFPLHTALYAVDETYVYADSRTPWDKQVRKFGVFVLQSRKTGCDVLYALQQKRTADLRLRENTEYFLDCERRGEQSRDPFKFEIRTQLGDLRGRYEVSYDFMERYVFPTFNTQYSFVDDDRFSEKDLTEFQVLLEMIRRREEKKTEEKKGGLEASREAYA
jgi:hypothetical protein